jgi:hypothetical protein
MKVAQAKEPLKLGDTRRTDKILDINNLEKERLILAHSFRCFSIFALVLCFSVCDKAVHHGEGKLFTSQWPRNRETEGGPGQDILPQNTTHLQKFASPPRNNIKL